MSIRRCAFRKSTLEGLYLPNNFLITLGHTSPYVRAAGSSPSLAEDHRHTFLHEYWHYLHNVTTVSGFKTFLMTQMLLSDFSSTLVKNKDGTSAGHSVLTKGASSRIYGALLLHEHIEGHGSPELDLESELDLSFRVVNLDTTTEEVELPSPHGRDKVPSLRAFIDVEISREGEAPVIMKMELGSLAIEESIAYMVEEQVRMAIGLAEEDPPPVFPYFVLTEVVNHLAPSLDISPLSIAGMGTLSLLMTHPGSALVSIIRKYVSSRRKGMDDNEALHHTADSCHRSLTESIQDILQYDLPSVLAMHEGRGLVAPAAEHLGGMFRDGLNARAKDPFFDLRRVFPVVQLDLLDSMMLAIPSCDVLQERDGDFDEFRRDGLFSLYELKSETSDVSASEAIRSFQAQQSYLVAHLDQETFEVLPSTEANAACPFYTACKLDQREQDPGTCRHEPWQAYSGDTSQCWYSAAVAATLGPVLIQKATVERVGGPAEAFGRSPDSGSNGD